MSRHIHFGRRQVTAAIAMALAGFRSAAAAANNLDISDPRPVAAALDRLEAKYNLAITYEDPPYLNPDDPANKAA